MKSVVSIIVPCYNQAQFLPDALDSLLSQSYSDWECIIVNDGSQDNTAEVANCYCKKDSRFRYLTQSNQGLANSRNNGIKLSVGKYILPLDADDKLKEDFIVKCVDVLENDSSCKFLPAGQSFPQTVPSDTVSPGRFASGNQYILPATAVHC